MTMTLSRAQMPVLLFSVAAISLMLIFLPDRTVRLTYDSHDYIAASESADVFFYGHNAEGISYLHRPPIFPFLLHWFSNKAEAGWWLNTVCIILSLATILTLSNRLGFSVGLQIVTASVVLLSTAWLQNNFFLWTEPLFSLELLVLALLLIDGDRLWKVLFVCFLLIFTRKAGLFVAAGVTVVYLLDGEIRRAIVVGGISLSVFLLWEGLIFLLTKTVTAYEILDAQVQLSRVYYFDSISGWIFPRVIPVGLRIIALAGIAIAALLLFLKSIYKSRKFKDIKIPVVCAVYLLMFILFFGMPDFYEAERYTSVILPLVFIMIFQWINFLWKRSQWYQIGAVVVSMYMIIYAAGRTIHYFNLTHGL